MSVTTIAIVIYDGFDELDAIGPYEVFANASENGCDLTVSLRTLESTEIVTASHGLRVEPDGVLDDADVLIVPGGGWGNRADRGAWGEVKRGDLPAVIRSFHDRGRDIASVCTGGMLLAAAEILDGRPATTHAIAIDALAEAGADVTDARIVDDGDVITAGGITSGLDLALWIVEQRCGATVAEQIARFMEYDRTGDVFVAG